MNETDLNYERRCNFHRQRSIVGWNPTKVGEVLGVAPRTIASWESGQQSIPDARWRHFQHEFLTEVERMRADNAQLLVIMSDDARPVPLDVLSEETYVANVIDPSGTRGVIASHFIDRNGKAQMHRQPYSIAANPTAVRVTAQWDERRRQSIPPDEMYTFNLHRWLVRQALSGMLRTPELEELRARVDRASEAVDNADDETRPTRLAELDKAIAAHMAAVSQQVAKTL